MKVHLNGITRVVFVFDSFVIKIPNFTYCHQHFLQGCYANWSERNLCKTWEGALNENEDFKNLYDLVVPSIFCSWFGLIQIQKKAEPMVRDLTEEELKRFDSVRGGEFKKENFGYYNNKLICLDYP